MWDALEDAREPPAAVETTRTVLVWRRDVTVIHRTLEENEADPAARAVELLLRWLDAGILRA